MSTRGGWMVLVLAGCGLGPGLTGSDPAPFDTEAGPLGTELCPVSGLAAECGPSGRSFTAMLGTFEGSTVVDLVHEGVVLPGCTPWAADAVPNKAGDRISIHYQPGAVDTADTGQVCECPWTFTYWVQLLPGTYTFDAMGDTATVTVPEG